MHAMHDNLVIFSCWPISISLCICIYFIDLVGLLCAVSYMCGCGLLNMTCKMSCGNKKSCSFSFNESSSMRQYDS